MDNTYNNASLFQKEKGTWVRFVKMLVKSKLPIIWIGIYILFHVVGVNMGASVTEYTSEMYSGNLTWATVLMPYLILSVLNLFTSGINTMISYVCRARIDRNLRRMVWDKFTKLPMSYFDRNKPRELLTRITSDTSVISSLLIITIIPFFTNLYQLYVIFAKVAGYDPLLMWSLLAVVPFVLCSSLAMGRMRFNVNDDVNAKTAEMARDMSEKITNISLIKATANEDSETETGKGKMKALYRSNIKATWVGTLASPIATIIGVLQVATIVLIGRTFYQSGAISLAQWIAYFAFAQQIANTLQSYSGYWMSLKSSQGATNRVSHIMDERNEDQGPDRSADDISGEIVLENVSFSYVPGKRVLDNVSFTIPEGKVTALVGKSGGGKTTALSMLERFYTPEEGRITLGGEDIQSYNLKSYRNQFGYLTQETTLVSGTIRENILTGITREVSEEEIVEACKAAYAWDFISEFPDGLDTDVGEGGGRLSGGQKQRIAIARVMLRNPRFLFMDEATAAMDAKAKQEVWAALENSMSGKTVIMVAHDWQTASHADYVVVFGDGKVEDMGTKKELLERNAFFQELANGKEDEE